jgi:hypothetical protein
MRTRAQKCLSVSTGAADAGVPKKSRSSNEMNIYSCFGVAKRQCLAIKHRTPQNQPASQFYPISLDIYDMVSK